MVRPLLTPDGDKITTPKGRGQKDTTTTAVPMQICSTTDSKKATKRPTRCGNHHGHIKAYGKILRIFHHKYTWTSKRKVIYSREKVYYEGRNGASICMLKILDRGEEG